MVSRAAAGRFACGLALVLGLGGCAQAGRVLGWHDRIDPPNGSQVAAFDGHVLWVDYACDGGQVLSVKYIGAWADAKTADGAVHRLAREGGPGVETWSGSGFQLTGSGMNPSWSINGAQPINCRGRL